MPMPPVREEGEPLLRADALAKTFHQSGHDVHALAGVSAEIWPGETLGLVGESGSGKTTLARVLLGITPRDEGGVLELDGRARWPPTHRQARPRSRCARSRSCSRTRTRRSTAGTRCGASSAAR